jgi:hypothetical protein
MGFSLVILIVIFDTEFQEFLQVFNCLFVIVSIDFLLDHCNLLVTNSFTVFVMRTLSNIKAFLEELKGKIKFVFILVLDCDGLVDSHQIARNFSCNSLQHALHSFL